MFQPKHLLTLSRILLLIGSLSLCYGAFKLAHKAIELGFNWQHFIWISPVALAAGLAKALFVMRPKMRSNAHRLMHHKGKLYPWQLYPAPLLLFIASMITIMAILKSLFSTHATMIAFLSAVDLAVAMALVVGSRDQRMPADRRLS